MAGHSFPVSLGLPRWRPCQILNPGATLKRQNSYPGEGLLSQFPVGNPPPPLTTTLGLNIDRCIKCSIWFTLGSENETNAWRFFPPVFRRGRMKGQANMTSKVACHAMLWAENRHEHQKTQDTQKHDIEIPQNRLV